MAHVEIFEYSWRVQTTGDTPEVVASVLLPTDGTVLAFWAQNGYRRTDTHAVDGGLEAGVAKRINSSASSRFATTYSQNVGTVTGGISSASPDSPPALSISVTGEPSATCEHFGYLRGIMRVA